MIQANLLSLVTTNREAINTVYNIAYGDRNTLNELMKYPKNYLSEYSEDIINIKPIYGPKRPGDVLHSHASIEKAERLLNYKPKYSFEMGLKEAVKWYYKNL